GVREQTNEITAYVDASNVYGSNAELASELRTLDGTGRLKTSEGDLLPFNVNGFPNAPNASSEFFLAGDFRANEQVYLTALHTLFVREHNFWCGQISSENPSLSGDQIYERARRIVGAEMQVVTYREFLPLVLGQGAIPPYSGYDDQRNAGISNVFATASYRFGHTMLSDSLLRLEADGSSIEDGALPLASAFFNPDALSDHGVEPLLRGLAGQVAQEIDPFIVDGVRNFLFGPPGSGGLDLASLNIQRGRDHGLPSYNQVRLDFGLSAASSFADVSSDPEIQARLASVYDSVDSIDVWIGGLSEDKLPGALVGELIFHVLQEQFSALRDGDRFWYRRTLPPSLQRLVEEQTLADIIRRNTSIDDEISDDVFRVVGATGGVSFVRGDCNSDGWIDLADALRTLEVLFDAGSTACLSGCDTDDSGMLTVGDAIQLLSGMFMGGPPPASPYPSCGLDPSTDALTCAEFDACP
ncbi:MAG: peroxidase family protein, partial [Planctomycetota bacterium]